MTRPELRYWRHRLVETAMGRHNGAVVRVDVR